MRGPPAAPSTGAILAAGQADTEAAETPAVTECPGRTVDQQPYMQDFHPVVQLSPQVRYEVRPTDIDTGANNHDTTGCAPRACALRAPLSLAAADFAPAGKPGISRPDRPRTTA